VARPHHMNKKMALKMIYKCVACPTPPMRDGEAPLQAKNFQAAHTDADFEASSVGGRPTRQPVTTRPTTSTCRGPDEPVHAAPR
jgi:hypothetical protein